MPTCSDNNYPSMLDFDIGLDGVHNLLTKLDTSKAVGPDQIPNQILKMAADELAPILYSNNL